jgi:prolipoprotein diacylglyceryltransferase
MFYGLGRFLIEILRVEPTVFGSPLSIAQFTGLVLVAIAGVLYPILKRHNSYPTE